MKIEVKNKENQRLSMANEQLQFRLQSHPNLSANQDTSLNSSSYVSFSDENKDNHDTAKQDYSQQQHQQPRHARAYTLHPSSATSSEDSADSISIVSPQPPPVKLRSKSFKNQNMQNKTSEMTSSMNKSLYSTRQYQTNQFRPVSDNFNFNINDQNINMTKSFNVMYDKHNNSSSSNDNYFEGLVSDLDRNEENCIKIKIDANEESSGSSTSLKSSSIINTNYHIKEDQMTKSVPCMVLKNSNNTHMETEFSDEESYSKSSDLEFGSILN